MTGSPSLVDRLVRELGRSFYGPTWHGPTLIEVVSDLNAQTASARHHPDVHTIGELVGHAAVWKEVVRQRLKGEAGRPASEAQNFPPVHTAADWQRCLARLCEAHETLVEVVAGQDPLNLDRTMPGDGTAFDQIVGIMQHDLYHAGQAVVVLKGLRAPGHSQRP